MQIFKSAAAKLCGLAAAGTLGTMTAEMISHATVQKPVRDIIVGTVMALGLTLLRGRRPSPPSPPAPC